MSQERGFLDTAGDATADLVEKVKPAVQSAAKKASGLFGKAKGFLDKQSSKPSDTTKDIPEKPAE